MSTALSSLQMDDAFVAKQVALSVDHYVFPAQIDQIEILKSNKIIDDLFLNNVDFIEYSLEAMSKFS